MAGMLQQESYSRQWSAGFGGKENAKPNPQHSSPRAWKGIILKAEKAGEKQKQEEKAGKEILLRADTSETRQVPPPWDSYRSKTLGFPAVTLQDKIQA